MHCDDTRTILHNGNMIKVNDLNRDQVVRLVLTLFENIDFQTLGQLSAYFSNKPPKDQPYTKSFSIEEHRWLSRALHELNSVACHHTIPFAFLAVCLNGKTGNDVRKYTIERDLVQRRKRTGKYTNEEYMAVREAMLTILKRFITHHSSQTQRKRQHKPALKRSRSNDDDDTIRKRKREKYEPMKRRCDTFSSSTHSKEIMSPTVHNCWSSPEVDQQPTASQSNSEIVFDYEPEHITLEELEIDINTPLVVYCMVCFVLMIVEVQFTHGSFNELVGQLCRKSKI